MKYVITGGAGYIGSRLVDLLSLRPDTERIAIADLRRPRYPRANTEFHEVDVRDRAALDGVLDRVRPDALVHLAFVLNPIHDEAAMYDIDVNGTSNALEAATRAGTEHVLVTSSTTAYGAFPDNPHRIDEDWPVRGVPNFSYARHKTEADRLCQLWAHDHPDRTMTIVRPCIVFGPNVDNYIVRSWESLPFFAAFRGLPDQEIQFVHEDDLVDAISQLLIGGHGGAFNVTGDGTMTWQETARLAGLKIRRVPFGLFYRFNDLAWRLRLPGTESPAGNLEFIRYPWVCSNDKVKETLGWQPQHASRETFELTLAARRARSGEAPAPAEAPSVLAESAAVSGNGHVAAEAIEAG